MPPRRAPFSDSHLRLSDFSFKYSQFLEFLGQLLRRVDNLGIVGEDLSLQFLAGILAVASLGKVDQTDCLLALLTDIGGESLLAVHAGVVVVLLPVGVQPFIKGDEFLEERVALTVGTGGILR